MDTYENESVLPEPEEQTPQEPVAQQEPEGGEDGFYHGTGVGTTENTYSINTPEQVMNEEPKLETPPRKPKRKIGKKVLKGALAAVVAIALVASGCGISVGVMNFYWKSQNENLVANFEERLEVLQKELDKYKDGSYSYVTSAEGLTPTQIYQQNIHSVVAINCVIQKTGLGQNYQATSAGSGFVLTEDGYVVTNHHVIEGAATISVAFSDGTKLAAELVGSDATNDIALLKVEATGLKPVTLGSSEELQVGEQVVAIGNALGELSFSLTAGYVSGIDREISTDGTVLNMIQTDVAINSGNSGGPLFNAKGEVVGITSAKYSGTTSSGASIEGISFAIPMDDVSGMLDDLREYGYIKTAYLGVRVMNVDSAVSQTYGLPLGAYVDSVDLGGSAALAGLRAKDIITNLGGYDIESMSDLTRALRHFEPGEESTIVVWRAGQTIALKIVFQEKPQS